MTVPSIRRTRGYTLIELLVVMAVLGVLAVMAAPLAEMAVQRQNEQELKRALWSIRDAIDAYKAARDSGAVPSAPGASRYPPTLEALTELSYDARVEFKGQPLRFLRAIPRDPFADPALAPGKTWALRSYLSAPEKPTVGDDIYDIHSESSRKALNGTYLKDW